MSTSMFRAAALRRVSSPEQLDSVVRSTLPRQWLALGALLAIVAGVVCWASIATVPTTVSGPGFFLPEGGLRQVDATLAGTVSSVPVQVGAHVVGGALVATVVPGTTGEAKPVAVTVPATMSAGTVTEVDVAPGSYVTPGEPLARIEPAGFPSVVYAFLPTATAAGLPTGLAARVTFAGGIGAFGFAEGTVASVSDYPVSTERLELVLQAGALVHEITAQGPSDEIVVQLELSSTTPSGLTWGSGTGPPGVLPPSLPTTVQLLVGTHHPISDLL